MTTPSIAFKNNEKHRGQSCWSINQNKCCQNCRKESVKKKQSKEALEFSGFLSKLEDCYFDSNEYFPNNMHFLEVASFLKEFAFIEIFTQY